MGTGVKMVVLGSCEGRVSTSCAKGLRSASCAKSDGLNGSRANYHDHLHLRNLRCSSLARPDCSE